MEINILLIIIFIIWLIICIKSKKRKVIKTLPYLLMIFILPFYNILDNYIFAPVFGCGCTKGFNANHLRQLVFSMVIIIAIILSILLSKSIKSTKHKILYILLALLVNVVLAYYICKIYMLL